MFYQSVHAGVRGGEAEESRFGHNFLFCERLLDIMIPQHIVLSQIIAMRTLKQCKQQIWSEHLEKYKTQNFMKCDAESLLVESCFVA